MVSFFNINSISKKLLFILMSVAVSSIATITFIFSAYEYTTAKREHAAGLDTLINVLTPHITAAVLFDDAEAVEEFIHPLFLRTDVVEVIVEDNDGAVIAQVTREAENYAKTIHEHTTMQGDYPVTINSANKEYTQRETLLTLDGQTYGTVAIVTDNSYLSNRITFYSYFIAVLLLFTIGFSYFLSLFLRKRFLTPILHLSEVAQSVSQSNNYSLRVQNLPNDEVGELASCINGMLTTIEQRDKQLENKVKVRTQELQNANKKLHEFAYNDGLTQLPNRRYFYEHLQQLIDRGNNKFSLIFLDLDGFKEINDSLGHDYGDTLLAQVAKRLRNCVRSQDVVARLGGDEFTLIVEGVNDFDRAGQIAEMIRKALTGPFTLKNQQANVSASIGITFYPQDGNDIETLIKHADQAMYLAKNKGRNCFEFFSNNIEQQALAKRELLDDLRQAIAKQQFELFYQPIFRVADKKIWKLEALIRWQHPVNGLMLPNQFIAAAEDSGLIADIGQWVRQQALSDWQQFSQLSQSELQITVNTSPLEIELLEDWSQSWIDAISDIDNDNQQKPNILIEITENILMKPGSSAQQQVAKLGKNGIHVAIDDFGVGYSSLSYLQQLDIDILKIDRSFITDMHNNEHSISLISAIISMAHSLGVEVVAEGVETQQQFDLLSQLDCNYLQGFLLSKPMSKSDLIKQYFNNAT
ncbi:putative bifunctional diguanylate cyclase/phosphodiesterase [Shewanella maritima]|uniref:putative bifunctional diguanylate cyclase/phosphodiesterase n=1 Tax=Shewanella maritima TaxID=2520507 RepID=UPI0037368129